MTMLPDHAVRDHALLGGSKADMWTNCTGSVFLSKDLPPEEPGPDALRGTHAHEIAATVLSDYLNSLITGEKPSRDWSDEDQDMVSNAALYASAFYKEILQGYITGKAWGVEELFILDEGLQMWGYVDAWAVYIDDRGKRVGVIGDYKYGYNYVSVEKNSQLAFYACAMREEIRRKGKDLDYVRAFIYQPFGGGHVYRETKFTAKQLDSWKAKFMKAAKQIFIDKKDKYKVGKHCRWCRAKAVCKAYSKNVKETEALKLVTPELSILPSVERLPDDAIVSMVLQASKIEEFLDAVKKYARERAKSANPLTGLKLVEGPAGKRKWTDDEDYIIKNLIEVGLEHPTKLKLRGITEIEKELSKLHGKEDAKRILTDFTEKTKSQPILVSSTDPRPAFDIEHKLITESEPI